jgi:flagellin
MAITVLNNIASLAAENQLDITNANLQNSLIQLASGSRINTGADDAAGLAIADGLEANITALTQSARNANDGVGELQVADGSLAQVTTLLNRAITLATESATGTVSDPQRVALNDEYTEIKAEIDRIGSTTNYNAGQVFTSTTLNVFLSDGGISSDSLIGVTTGDLSSTGLGLGGPVGATATLTETPATLAGQAVSTITGGTFSAATASTSTLTATGAFTGATQGTGTISDTSSTAPTSGDTVTIGGTVYTFETTLGAVANSVLIGANSTIALANLTNAINDNTVDATGSGAGGFANVTAANTSVTATHTTAATTVTLTNRVNGATTVAGSASSTVLTTTGTAAGAAGDTVSIGGKTYTFVTSFGTTGTGGSVANEVLAGTEQLEIANLVNAVNNTAGAAGSTAGTGGWSTATTANAQVSGGTNTATTALFTSLASGAGALITGDAVTGGHASFSAPTAGTAGSTVTVGATTYQFVSALTAGIGGADQVLIGTGGTAEATSLSNLAAAINGGSGSGVDYGTGTTPNLTATASAPAGGTTVVLTSINAGTTPATPTLTAITGGSATGFTGGTAAGAAGVFLPGDTVTVGTQTYIFLTALSATPTANQVLIGNTDLDSLNNLANAVNGGSGAGATYGAPTLVNTSATAVATADSIIFTSKVLGTAGNTLVATTTSTGNTFPTAAAGLFANGAAGSINDLLSIPDAISALTTINNAIQTVAELRGTIGATVNRLQSAATVITNQVQNLTGAEDGVRAADIPTVVANLAKYTILEQTGISALAQSNQDENLILKLLQ